MRKIEFDTSKSMTLDLSDLKAGSITIKEIEAENFDMFNQIFQIKTTYSDHEIQFPLVLGGYITSMSRLPKIQLDCKIEDSDNTIIEAKHDIKTKYIIYYETLIDKIKRLKDKKEEKQLNIKNEVDNWRKSLSKLYADIEEWIQPIKDEIQSKRIDLLITEELTGPYKTESLVLSLFNGGTISFNPKGTFVIGSKGRVDLSISGRYQDSIMLILQRIDNIDKWTIIKNRDLHNAREFNKGQFLNLLDNVI
jgi:hypothetical protein